MTLFEDEITTFLSLCLSLSFFLSVTGTGAKEGRDNVKGYGLKTMFLPKKQKQKNKVFRELWVVELN